MRELVDKQLMLEDVKSWVAMDSYEQHLINNMSEWIENLPTVEASDGDCISRRVVIETISRMMPKSYTLDGSHPADEEIFMAQEIYADCIKAIEILPSAQPERKMGKWIYNSPVTMKCNQCGFVIKDWDWHRFKFCPNCDCDMRGEQK